LIFFREKWYEKLEDNKIPEEIRVFTYKYITSLEQLEVLCQFVNNPNTELNSSMLNQTLKTNTSSIESRLEDLFNKGFLVLKNSEKKLYQYGPRTDQLHLEARKITQFYKDNYHSMINLIYSKPMDNIRSFADSFKLRKDD
jgi:hypothetical protein